MTDQNQEIKANPEVVLGILQLRAQADPFIRELLRGAILEAHILSLEEATDSPEVVEPEEGDA
jgi:hypothetical protein